jgi:thiamine kinase-like enzyme
MLTIESIINGWSQWNAGLHEKPGIIRELRGGQSNRNFLLKSAGQYLVLRINGAETLLPGHNRHAESRVWQAASEAGLAPPLLFASEQQGILLSAYIEDQLPGQPKSHSVVIEQAFKLLQSCHQLDVSTNDINYTKHVQHYWRLIETRGNLTNQQLPDQRKPMQQLLKELQNINPETGLCHHDPVIANFVGSEERLYLVDWEYAATGLLIMDYAALGVEWGFDDNMLAERSGIEAASLVMAKELYCYFCALWKEIKAEA